MASTLLFPDRIQVARRIGQEVIRMLRIARILTAFAAWLACASAAAPALVLDQARIHSNYNNGDFDSVIHDLENYFAGAPAMTHDDSVFVCKHLAVVYSAMPETRERGKFFMYRLLELMPYAQLVDMFVSEEINRIFERVRAEFYVRQKALGKADPYAQAHAEAGPMPVGLAMAAMKPAAERTASDGRQSPAAWKLALRMARPSEPSSQGLRILAGYRFLPGSPWPALQRQAMAGVGFDKRPWPIPLGFTARALYSLASGGIKDPSGILRSQHLRTDAFEADAGLKALAEGIPFFQPFAEAGWAYYRAVLLDDTGGDNLSDADWAPWIGAGLQCTLYRHATLAFQIDRTFADIEFSRGARGGRPLAMMASAGYRW
jgi:hypothetical protein